jgi:hypothetical protein
VSGGASPRHEVSLKSPQARIRGFSGCAECKVLRSRVSELEETAQALEGALEARAMATVSLRAKVGGGSPKSGSDKARLREECDSLRLTVDFCSSYIFEALLRAPLRKRLTRRALCADLAYVCPASAFLRFYPQCIESCKSTRATTRGHPRSGIDEPVAIPRLEIVSTRLRQ